MILGLNHMVDVCMCVLVSKASPSVVSHNGMENITKLNKTTTRRKNGIFIHAYWPILFRFSLNFPTQALAE